MSVFDPNNPFDVEKSKTRLKWLIDHNKRFEIKEIRERRSISQNSYLHLILSWYAQEYGETLEYIKQEVFKKKINPAIFKTEYINEKTGEIRDDWRSSASLDTKEMTTAIDRFRDYSSKEAGIYLPEPTDMAALNYIETEIKKNKYL